MTQHTKKHLAQLALRRQALVALEPILSAGEFAREIQQVDEEIERVRKALGL